MKSLVLSADQKQVFLKAVIPSGRDEKSHYADWVMAFHYIKKFSDIFFLFTKSTKTLRAGFVLVLFHTRSVCKI